MSVTVSRKADTGGATPLRTGESFLADLRAGERTIFVDGERISDPTGHPAFKNSARTFARLFDHAAAPENRERMTFIFAGHRRTGLALLPDSPQPRGPARQAPRGRGMGGADLRVDGGARPTMSGISSPAMRPSPSSSPKAGPDMRERRELLQIHSRQPQIRDLRDRPAADRPQQAGPSAERPDPLCRRGQGNRFPASSSAAVSSSRPEPCSPIMCRSAAFIRCGPGDENYAISVAIPLDAPGVKLFPAARSRCRPPTPRIIR